MNVVREFSRIMQTRQLVYCAPYIAYVRNFIYYDDAYCLCSDTSLIGSGHGRHGGTLARSAS